MNARGIREIRDYENGKKLSLKQGILGKCCDCMGKYADGKRDCGIPECTLYPWMPYGEAWRYREKKIMSQKHLEIMRQGLKRGKKSG